MAEYRGVDVVARKIVKEYRGVDGIARKIVKEYRGVDGVARQYFSSGPYYKIIPPNANDDGDDMPNGLPAEYVQKVEDGVLTISGTSTGTGESSIQVRVYGDLGGKEIAFTYKTTGYNAFYSTIEFTEVANDGSVTKSQLTSTTSKSFTKILPDNINYVRFSVWLGLSVRTASLEVWDLTIDGESVLI